MFSLQTKANDLQSKLALRLKREILKSIHDGCPAYKDDPAKQQEIFEKYKRFGDQVMLQKILL